MSANSAQAGDSAAVPVHERPPYEREWVIAEKRAEWVAAGRPVEGSDAVTAEMREQERKMLDGLSQWATLVVASFCAEHAETLALLPTAVSQGLIVRATVAYLYGYGLMVPAPPDGTDSWHPMSWQAAIPEHLWPDAEEARRGYERLLSQLGGFGDNTNPADR